MVIKFWKVTWLFFNYDSTLTGRLTFIELRRGIETYRPPIGLSPDEESDLQMA